MTPNDPFMVCYYYFGLYLEAFFLVIGKCIINSTLTNLDITFKKPAK